MKKYLALLLSMLLLVGCARIEPEQGGTKPEPGQPDDVSAKLLSQYALAEVKLPELPAEPSEEELWTAYEKARLRQDGRGRLSQGAGGAVGRF